VIDRIKIHVKDELNRGKHDFFRPTDRYRDKALLRIVYTTPFNEL
jgi:hypothetical protein